MAERKISQAKPGATVTRKVTEGPGKGDTVQFKANSASARLPGKLVPRRVIKDVPPLNTQSSLPHGKKKPNKQSSFPKSSQSSKTSDFELMKKDKFRATMQSFSHRRLFENEKTVTDHSDAVRIGLKRQRG
jgi:hypothetical protein